MNKKNQLVIFFLIWFFVVSVMILKNNPLLFQFGSIYKDEIFRQSGGNVEQNFILADHPADGPATFEYRGGPLRQGFYESDISPPLILGLKTDQLNYAIHSASKSSPAVDASGLFVGADTSWFEAYDFSGANLWSYFANNSARGAHGTASLDATSVYIGSYNGYFYRFDKRTGRPFWVMKMLGASGCSSILDGEFLYICTESGTDGYLAKLKRRTGELVWKTALFGEQVHSSPTLDHETKTVYIGNNRGGFIAYDTESGIEKWSFQVGSPVKGTAAIFENQICFSSWSKEFICLDKRSGSVLHRYDLVSRSQSSAAIDPEEGIAYVYSGVFPRFLLSAFDLKKHQLLWRKAMEENASGTSPVLTKSKNARKILWGNCSMKSFCAFDPRTGRELWQISLDKYITSVPTLYQDQFFISLDDGPLVQLKKK